MATIDLTTENFEETVTSNDIVLIDFWAEWCGPCKMFGPIFESTSEAFANVVFAKVDTEAEQALAASFNIMSIPTLMAIREQVVIFSQAGAMPKDALVDVIEQILALDMEQVHREVAAQGEVGAP